MAAHRSRAAGVAVQHGVGHVTPPPGDVRNTCLVCGTPGRNWLQAHGRDLLRCPRCRFAWIPQGVKRNTAGLTIYEDDTPVFFTPDQADYYRDDTARDAARDKLAWVQTYVPGGRLLDVGANVGLFAREATTSFDAVGIEPSQTVVDWGRHELGAPLQRGSIEHDTPEFRGAFDAVTLFDVVEHLADPERGLARCHEYLKPGGHLFVTTPDAGSLMSRLLGRQWYYVDMDEHVSLFSRRTLTTVLERAGFVIVATRSIGRAYRFSYIRRRLRFLGRQASAMRLLHAATWPLSLAPDATMRIDLRDVMGIVARRV